MECIIYKLECLDENIKDCYVGSTNDLKRRFRSHRFNCNNKSSNEYNLPVYNFIRDNGGIKNWKILELERFVCDSKIEKLKRERYYIELLESSLNNQIPSRTHKEYYENNKQEILEYHKDYYDKNKNEINKKNNERYKKNKDEYSLKNKELYEKNKDLIKNQKKEIIICECGIKSTRGHIQRHRKTKKHLDLINSSSV